MTEQERLAEGAISAAEKCAAAGNHPNADHFWRLAATHLELAAEMVPCIKVGPRRGEPVDSAVRTRISTRYREVLNHVFATARRMSAVQS